MGLSGQCGVVILFVGLFKGSRVELKLEALFLLAWMLISVFVLFVLLSVAFAGRLATRLLSLMFDCIT